MSFSKLFVVCLFEIVANNVSVEHATKKLMLSAKKMFELKIFF